jgi:hypothetical protein
LGADVVYFITFRSLVMDIIIDWWFGTWILFLHNIWDNNPNWLIFFRGIETTNQFYIMWYFDAII